MPKFYPNKQKGFASLILVIGLVVVAASAYGVYRLSRPETTKVLGTVTRPPKNYPSVAITSPTNGSSVSGLVTIIADARDFTETTTGIKNVEFWVCDLKASTCKSLGYFQYISTDSSYIYSAVWNTTNFTAGSYRIKAVAFGTNGLKAEHNVDVKLVKDQVLPTVTITAPLNGAQVSGAYTITANANDNVGIKNVEFWFCDLKQTACNAMGYFQYIGYDSTSAYSNIWQTSSLTPGNYRIKVVAFDTSDNKSEANVDVSVISSIKVSITSPINNSTVSGTVNINATATDVTGIKNVEFWFCDTKQTACNAMGYFQYIGYDATSPYSIPWNTSSLTAGTYILKAVAFNNSNVHTETNVTVNLVK